MRLISVSIAWVVGVYLGSLVSLPPYALVLACIPVLLIALLWRRKTMVLWGGLCLAILFGGVVWYGLSVSEPNVQEFSGRKVVIEGKVVRDSQYSDYGAWFGLSAERVCVGDSSEEVSGKVLVYTDPVPTYSQGDVLRMTGMIEPLSDDLDSGYRTFLVRQGFVGVVDSPAEIELLDRSWLFSFRNRLAESISSALPEPQASLAEGLLLGIRSHMPDELKSDFSRTGTSHLLAISGFNLAVIGGAILGAAAWVFGRQRPVYLLVTLIVVWLYSALTGMQPPVFRSAIMFSLFIVALGLGRPGNALPALALSAAVMVGLSPRVLWDVSFQLSFAAVAGLMLIQPPLQQWGEQVLPEDQWASSVVKPVFYNCAVGFAAIAATLPLMVYYFQSFSLVGLPATVLASVFVTGATMLVGITALLGLFAPPLAWAVGLVATFFLMCIIGTVEWFGHLPHASVGIGSVSAAVVWVYYIVLLTIVSRKRLVSMATSAVGFGRRWLDTLAGSAYRLPKKRTAGALVVSASLIWLAVLALPDGTKLEVSFLDVGQGDAILISTPAGQQILIDGGPNPDTVCHELGKKLPFWDKSLDMVVLTHCHDDHLIGLMGVLKRYKVGQVLESGLGNAPAYREWLAEIEEKEIGWTIAMAGQEIDLGHGIWLEVIYPGTEPAEDAGWNPNDDSVVLRLVWGKVSFLLTGDVDGLAEQDVLYGGEVYTLRSTVLKVSHHGSSASTSSQLLDVIDPQVAVISVGEDNTFGHPSDKVLARLDGAGVDVYRTDQCGTITFSTDGERLWVRTAKSSE